MTIRYRVLLLIALLLYTVPVQAKTGGGAVVPGWIEPEDVPVQAEALLQRLEDLRPKAAAQESLNLVKEGFATTESNLETALHSAKVVLQRSALTGDIEDARQELVDAAAPLDGWQRKLGAEAKRVAAALDEIEQKERLWSETRGRPETVAAGEVVERRVQSTLDVLRDAKTDALKWQARVLALSDHLVDRSVAVNATLDELQSAKLVLQDTLFVPNRTPLWQSDFGPALQRELPRVRGDIGTFLKHTRNYLKTDARFFAAQVLLAALLILFFCNLSVRARKGLAADSETESSGRVLAHPYAGALLLAFLATPFFHPAAPRQVTQLLSLFALFPAIRLLVCATGRSDPIMFGGIIVLFLVDRFGLAVALLPKLARLTFLLELAITFGLTVRFKRSLHLVVDMPWLRYATNLATPGLVIAFLAEIGGWANLSMLLGRGIIAAAIAYLFIYVAVIFLSAAFSYALTSTRLQEGKLFQRSTSLLGRYLQRGLQWIGAGVWIYFILIAQGLRPAAAKIARTVLHAGVSVGELSITVGNILAFVLTLLAAILFARIVDSVLEEQVFPRTKLPRGIPYVLATLVRYAAYSLGFLFALAAAGVKLGQAAIMVGGLGVGIGLGLQDLVKNFAAGLTLLLERRVHVGDTLQIPGQDIFGRARSIGLRATVIRCWNGTEVLVPNSDLVSTPVTNWTLSDLLQRIEIPVGVAYGTDPEQVIALLGDVARANLRVLPHPKPQGLFRAFGDSSLDFALRVWTDVEHEQTAPLISELGIAINRSLKEAGITIPFPQRDLHLASVSPTVSPVMAGSSRDES